MQYIELKNHVRIPQLGLGVFKTPAGEQTEDAVKWALQAGYRHIDAAKIYRNEEGVGRAIKESGVPREEIFVTTKAWNEDIRTGRTREAFAESLAALQLDYVDLYLIHWPVARFEEAWKDMEALYAEGRIHAIGVSNFQIHHLQSLEKAASVSPMVNQIESNPYFNNQTVIDYCLENGVAVEVWSPLGGTGGNQMEDATIACLARKHEKTPAQIIIRWMLQRGLIVMPKSTHKERIESNLNVFDFALTDAEMAQMQGLDRGVRTGADPDNFHF